MPTANGASRLPSQAPSSERSERKRKRRRRRSVKAGDGTSPEAAGKRIREDEEKEAEKKSEDEEVVSSAPSSPLCHPAFPHGPDPPPELIEAFKRAEHDYEIKRDRHGHLVTMEHCRHSQMFFNPELFPVAELATKAVLLAGRFVVGLSSSFDGNQLTKRCSGFWIDWEKENKTGIVLTSTHLISSKGCSVETWGDGVEEEYAPRGKVKYYPHAKYDNGGPIIDLDANVVGIITGDRSGSFIPSSVLLKCLDLWKEFECIPRPQLGLLFSCIKLLDFVQVEKIWLKYKIDDGLIVNEVLKGSHADEIGIRRGDIIESFNGECISTTVQLENLLLSLCKSAGRGLDSKIHVSVRVFQVRKRRRKTREFTVGVSLSLEVIERVYKLVTLEEGTSATMESDLTKWLS